MLVVNGIEMGAQITGIAITVVIALVTGLLAGKLISLVREERYLTWMKRK